MRVICGECSKAYAVADHLIPAKGARAQCPRCGHRQLIKKAEGAEAAAGPAAEAAPRPAPGTAAGLGDVDLGLDFPGALAVGAPPPAAAAPAPARAQPARAPTPPPPASAAAASPAEQTRTCDVCGTAISSPFDIAVGMCENCQALAAKRETAQRAQAAPPGTNPLDTPAAAPAPGAPAAPVKELGKLALNQLPRDTAERPKAPPAPRENSDSYRFKKADGTIAGPFPALELPERLEKGEITVDDEVSRANETFRKWSEYPVTLGIVRRDAARKEEEKRLRRARRMRVGAIAGGIVVAGVAALLIVKPVAIFGRPVEKLDDSMRVLVTAWRAQVGEVATSASELIKEGRERMASDSPSGYRMAIQAFKRALIREPGNASAASGLVEAIALSWSPDDFLLREANMMSERLARVPTAEAHRARAHLKLSFQGDPGANEAQAEANKARALGGDEPATLVTLARANLEGNAPSALDLLTRALIKDKSLRRAMLWRAEAELAVGRLAAATATLRARAELDPANPEVWAALGQARRAAGDAAGAMTAFRSALQSDPRHYHARLGLAVLSYQTEGDLATANEMLTALRKDAARFSVAQRGPVLVQSAIVARESGNADEAVEMARAAVEADPLAPGAAFQLGLALLAKGDASNALAAAGMVDPTVDAGRKSDLVARAEAARGKNDVALGHFSSAIELAPQRIDPILRASALFAKADRVPQALTMLRKALDTDPAHRATHETVWEQFESNRDLAAVQTTLLKLLSRTDQKELVRAGLAIVDYHLGDVEAARGHLAAAGESSLAAHIYRAQIALDGGRPEDALKSALQAIRLDRLSPVASYLAAGALIALKRPADARARLRDTLEADPHFLPAVAREAELMAAGGERDAAVERLLRVWRSDPENVIVRRALDRLGY